MRDLGSQVNGIIVVRLFGARGLTKIMAYLNRLNAGMNLPWMIIYIYITWPNSASLRHAMPYVPIPGSKETSWF